jgi:hypothetical protein
MENIKRVVLQYWHAEYEDTKRQHCRMKKPKAVEPDRGRKSYWPHFAARDIA